MPSCNVVAGVRVAGVEKLRRRVLLLPLSSPFLSSLTPLFSSLLAAAAKGKSPGWLGFWRRGRGGFIGEALGVGVARTPGNGMDVTGSPGGRVAASGLHSGFRARGERGKRAWQGIGPTAGADAGVSRAGGRREMRSARCRVAPRGKSRGARVVVRRKGKLTGGARLSVAHGGERAMRAEAGRRGARRGLG